MNLIATLLSNIELVLGALLAIPLLGVVGWLIYTRTKLFQGPGEDAFKAHIQDLGRNHDVVVEVEWKDGNVTYMGADYDVDGGHLELENGLPVELPGQSGTPVQLYGVPLIRTSAHVAAPMDTELAIAMEKEEDGNFTRVTDQGERVEPGEQTPAVADGGAEVVDHEYEWGGTAYSLTSLWERAPAIDNRTIDKHFELGKEWARGGRDRVKELALAFFGGMGTVLVIGIIGFVFLKVVGVV
jgi:hypothetical protein